MRADVYLVSTPAGNAISLDEAKATQYAADHGGVLHRLSKDDAARLAWLGENVAAFINAAAGGWDADAICVASPPGHERQVDIRAFIDALRHG